MTVIVFYNLDKLWHLLMFVKKITNLNCFHFCHLVVYQICELCQLGQVDRVVYEKYELHLSQMDQDLHHVQGLYLELMLKMVTNVLKICSVPAKKIELSLQKLLLSLQKPLCPWTNHIVYIMFYTDCSVRNKFR